MIAMIRADLITMRGYILQQLAICVLVILLIWIGTNDLFAGLVAAAVMLPFMYAFSIEAYDEMSGWERFRLTLPISRRQVAFGRYASILVVLAASNVLMLAVGLLADAIQASTQPIGLDMQAPITGNLAIGMAQIALASSIMLVVTAIALPIFLRIGMTKGTRLVPLAIVLLIVIGLGAIGNLSEESLTSIPFLNSLLDPAAEPSWALFGICTCTLCLALILYATSALVAWRLYEGRQF